MRHRSRPLRALRYSVGHRPYRRLTSAAPRRRRSETGAGPAAGHVHSRTTSPPLTTTAARPVAARSHRFSVWPRRRTLRIGLFGSLGLPNFGDELILHSVLEALAEQHPGARVHIFSFTPAVTHRHLPPHLPLTIHVDDSLWQVAFDGGTLATHEIRERATALAVRALRFRDSMSPLKRLARALHRVDLLHGIGGGYLNSHSPHSLLATSLLIELAGLLQKRIVFTGQTVGPCDAACVQLLLPQFARVQAFDVRDSGEVDRLRDAGVPVSQSCDDSLLALGTLLQLAADSTTAPRDVVLCLQRQTDAESRARLVAAMRGLVEAVDTGQAHVRLVFLELSPHLGADRELFDLAGLQTNDRVQWVPFTSVLDTAARIVGPQTCAVVGTRLHLALPALACGVPCLSLVGDDYYARKISGMHLVFGSTNWLKMDDLRPQSLVDFLHSAPRRLAPAELTDRVTLAAQKRQVLESAWQLPG